MSLYVLTKKKRKKLNDEFNILINSKYNSIFFLCN